VHASPSRLLKFIQSLFAIEQAEKNIPEPRSSTSIAARHIFTMPEEAPYNHD